MPIDNAYYDTAPDTWRNGTQPLSLLDALTPSRFAYLRGILVDGLAIDPRGTTALDVGCGGGLLAEEFARLGCRVIGVDPSDPSLVYAREHAATSGLDIDYRQGTGECLPVQDAGVDIVYCCDVLEHVRDLDRVIAETSRVLKPGGVYLYDTINRTVLSNLIVIKVAQEWKRTRIIDVSLHDWSMFIKPEELLAILARHGLNNQEMVGFGPRGNPLKMLAAYRRLRRRRTTYSALGKAMNTGPIGSMSISYMGHAIKR